MKVVNFVSLLLIISCTNQNQSRIDAGWIRTITPLDSLTLDFVSADTLNLRDFVLGDYADYQIVEKDDTTFLIGINSRDHALDVINLTTKVSEKQIQFALNGPDGIKGMIDGFFYHNADSIFILSIDENAIHLFNNRARKINKYEFSNVPLPDGFTEYDVYADQGLMNGPYYNAKNKTLQLYTYRWVDARNDNYDYKAFASYSIEDNEFKSIYGVYPAHFKKGVNFSLYNDPSLLVIDDISYVYFSTSPDIQVYNNQTGDLLYVVNYHSDHWSGSPESLPSNVDFQQEQDWLNNVAAYIFLIHDSENEVIYRLMKHKQQVAGDNGLLNPRWLGEWSVDIFDLGLKPIGHFQIPSKKVLPAIAFTANGKLWLKNPFEPANEDLSLYYQLGLRERSNE